MVDCISREAAKEFFLNMDAGSRAPCSALLTPEEFAEYLDEIPAADVEPVRHVCRKVWGEYEYYGEWLRCPRCRFNFNTVFAKFCGGCGAKMDLEDEYAAL